MSRYRRIALEKYGEACFNCGSTDTLEVHHRNGDRTDNRVENLLPLCDDCHNKLHTEGLNGIENELKPVDKRSHIDDSTTNYQFNVSSELWNEWKDTVPRSKTLDERILELIQADTDNRVNEGNSP